MKTILQSLHTFLETKSGLLILGFTATTVCGGLLNFLIQSRQSENEHSFAMYKTRLAEAKELQARLLARSSARSFFLEQVLTKLAHAEEYKPGEILKYWNDHVTTTKDDWNKDLYYLHAQTRVLFKPELADMVRVYEENVIVHDQVMEKLVEATYRRTLPTSLQGAFVDAHATLYYLLTKCERSGDCRDRADLLKLAEKQMSRLAVVEQCVAYRISSELLRYPYGPRANVEIEMPAQCEGLPKT
jgi:hypothetical protein